jgi:hypothetical protein
VRAKDVQEDYAQIVWRELKRETWAIVEVVVLGMYLGPHVIFVGPLKTEIRLANVSVKIVEYLFARNAMILSNLMLGRKRFAPNVIAIPYVSSDPQALQTWKLALDAK